jgi:murein DD-endopeptidase MepM/ murein hydrolase activator NlpD
LYKASIPQILRQVFSRLAGRIKLFQGSSLLKYDLSQIERVLRVTPALKKVKARLSGIFGKKPFLTPKRLASVFLCSTLFFAAGAEPTEAFSKTNAAEKSPYPVGTVYIDGREIGSVLGFEIFYSALESAVSEVEAKCGMDVQLKSNIKIQQTNPEDAKFRTAQQIKESLLEYGQYMVDGAVLAVDGVEITAMKSADEINAVLETIRAKYTSDDGSVEEVYFSEKVEIKEQAVPFDRIQKPEAVVRKLLTPELNKASYIIEEGDTLWSIRKIVGLSIGEILELNPGLEEDSILSLGQEIVITCPEYLLNVATVEIVEYIIDLPFKTETRKDSTMYVNESKVIQNGQEGAEAITERVTRINGIVQEREITARETIREPVNKIVAKGTKAVPTKASTSRSSSSKALLWPAAGRISSKFGPRWGRQHKGLDIANSVGTPIYAAEAGKVIASYRSASYGNIVKISHSNGMVTYYAHMSSRVAKEGQTVKRGQLIGYMGSTGRSTGSHLHFEVRINGVALNPLKYLP